MTIPRAESSAAHRLPSAPRDYSALIRGEMIHSKDRESIVRASPAHGVPVSRYPKATLEDVERAITSARVAADGGPWAGMSGADRARILNRVAQLIDKHRDELGMIESLEVGKPVSAVGREIQGSVGLWEFAATLARHAYGDLHDKLGPGALGLVFREPVGVVGMITPWNYPLLIVSQKLPFALAVGCCAVVKPSELTSGTALRLGELLCEAGVPPGVVNIVVGDGAIGEAICRNPLVDMISFTGSTRVGRRIGSIAGEAVKRVSLELGGKSAQIVCADADLELAAERVTVGVTRNCGQACVSGSRLLVERSVARELTQAVADRMARIRIGDPLDPATEMGPLVSQAQFDRVSSYLAAGQKDGAQLHRPAEPLSTTGGYFMQPGLFTHVRPTMSIAQEEIFGPVLSVIEFDTIAEAIEIANGTIYGLAGSVWTRDINKAFAIGRALKTGTVEVNTYMAGAPELPLVGHKQSGVGHEKGRYAVEEFTHLKTIQLQLTNPLVNPS
jgi:acyl-CoA reductase-like NAD-dependent aldehyde dehydrogenase